MTIDINDFPYYRDSVLVKRFESFVSSNPEGQDSWIDITDPINWSPNNKIYWTGTVWKVINGGNYPELTCVNDTFKNFFPYAYRFTFNSTALTSVILYNAPGSSSVYLYVFSGQDYINFPASTRVFKTTSGDGNVIKFLQTDLLTFEISKIEIRKIHLPQDFDWAQIWDVDITNLIDYNFNGFFIKDDSLFIIGYKDNNLILCSYSTGAWLSETIEEDPDIGGVGVPFIYNNRIAHIIHGSENIGFSYQDESLNWQFETIPFTINPSPAINVNGTAIAFAPGNVYSAVVHDYGLYLNILKRTGDSFATLASPETLPTGAGYDVCWSRTNDTYLVVAHTTGPYVTIYKRSSDVFTKLSNPGNLPAGQAECCEFSPDDTYLAIGHAASPYFTIYKRSSDTFTKLANPGTLPSSIVLDVSWSHDGIYLACGCYYSPGNSSLIVYKRSGDTFTKLAELPSQPTSSVTCVSFSHDSGYLFAGNEVTGVLYTRSGDTFSVSNALSLTGYFYGAKWSSDSTYLMTSAGVYKNESGVFTSLNTNVDNLYGFLTSGKLDISDDDVYFGIGSAEPIHIFKRTGDLFNQISQGASIEETTASAITPFVDSNNNILLLVDLQRTVRIYKRTPAGTWTRYWCRGITTYSYSFWTGREFGTIDSSNKVHYAYFTIIGQSFQLSHLIWDNGVSTSEIVDPTLYSTQFGYYYYHESSIILQDNGNPIILYSTPTNTKLAIFNGATWDFTTFPITLFQNAKMIHKTGKLYIRADNSQFIIYNISTGLIEKSDYIYPEKVVNITLAPSQNLEKTDFYVGINYNGYKWLIYKRGTGTYQEQGDTPPQLTSIPYFTDGIEIDFNTLAAYPNAQITNAFYGVTFSGAFYVSTNPGDLDLWIYYGYLGTVALGGNYQNNVYQGTSITITFSSPCQRVGFLMEVTEEMQIEIQVNGSSNILILGGTKAPPWENAICSRAVEYLPGITSLTLNLVSTDGNCGEPGVVCFFAVNKIRYAGSV